MRPQEPLVNLVSVFFTWVSNFINNILYNTPLTNSIWMENIFYLEGIISFIYLGKGSLAKWGNNMNILVSFSHILITVNCSTNFAIYCSKVIFSLYCDSIPLEPSMGSGQDKILKNKNTLNFVMCHQTLHWSLFIDTLYDWKYYSFRIKNLEKHFLQLPFVENQNMKKEAEATQHAQRFPPLLIRISPLR